MNNEKVYILQKDMPYVKAGAEYKEDFGDYKTEDKHLFTTGLTWDTLGALAVENNPEWFKLKEEVKPTVSNVTHFKERLSFDIELSENEGTSIPISKERLAEILINESKGRLFIDNEEDRGEKGKVYSEKEYLQFGEDCWEAARLKEKVFYNPNLQQQINWRLQNQVQNSSYQVDKYKTLSEYLNDKQNQSSHDIH